MIEKRVTILVAEGHPSVRENLRYTLNADADLECVGVAKDPIQALERCRALAPDVLVLGDNLAGVASLAVAQQVWLALPQVRVVVFTEDLEICDEARRLGVSACVSKEAGYEVLLRAVRDAAGLPSSSVPTDPFSEVRDKASDRDASATPESQVTERQGERTIARVARDVRARAGGAGGRLVRRVRSISRQFRERGDRTGSRRQG